VEHPDGASALLDRLCERHILVEGGLDLEDGLLLLEIDLGTDDLRESVKGATHGRGTGLSTQSRELEDNLPGWLRAGRAGWDGIRASGRRE
jgi:hypothetical protein